MRITENPFYILGCTPSDGRETILECLENALLAGEFDERAINEAAQKLLSPRGRVEAMICYTLDDVPYETIKSIAEKILIKQLQSGSGTKSINQEDRYELSIEELGLSVRTMNCLQHANIKTVKDIAQMTRYDIVDVPNIREKTLKEIIEKIDELGLPLRARENWASRFDYESFGLHGILKNEKYKRLDRLKLVFTGYDRDGYDRDGYDRDGYDENGWNREGFNHAGFAQSGQHRNGTTYNDDGYAGDGYDKCGNNQYGKHICDDFNAVKNTLAPLSATGQINFVIQCYASTTFKQKGENLRADVLIDVLIWLWDQCQYSAAGFSEEFVFGKMIENNANAMFPIDIEEHMKIEYRRWTDSILSFVKNMLSQIETVGDSGLLEKLLDSTYQVDNFTSTIFSLIVQTYTRIWGDFFLSIEEQGIKNYFTGSDPHILCWLQQYNRIMGGLRIWYTSRGLVVKGDERIAKLILGLSVTANNDYNLPAIALDLLNEVDKMCVQGADLRNQLDEGRRVLEENISRGQRL